MIVKKKVRSILGALRDRGEMAFTGAADNEQREAYCRAAVEAAIESGVEGAGEPYACQGSLMYAYRAADELRCGVINICGRLTNHGAVRSCN